MVLLITLIKRAQRDAEPQNGGWKDMLVFRLSCIWSVFTQLRCVIGYFISLSHFLCCSLTAFSVSFLFAHSSDPWFHSWFNPAIRISRNIDLIIMHDFIFDVIITIITGNSRAISTAISKNRSENGSKRTPVCWFGVVCSLVNTDCKETDVWTALNHIVIWLVMKLHQIELCVCYIWFSEFRCREEPHLTACFSKW
jgi:hypothetical protein